MGVNYKKDTGWAWVVLGASVTACLHVSLTLSSFAVYYPHVVSYYDAGVGQTGWIATLMEFSYNCSGKLKLLKCMFSLVYFISRNIDIFMHRNIHYTQ
jgi:hypothetical protein